MLPQKYFSIIPHMKFSYSKRIRFVMIIMNDKYNILLTGQQAQLVQTIQQPQQTRTIIMTQPQQQQIQIQPQQSQPAQIQLQGRNIIVKQQPQQQVQLQTQQTQQRKGLTLSVINIDAGHRAMFFFLFLLQFRVFPHFDRMTMWPNSTRYLAKRIVLHVVTKH